jgi:hypothetical protein
MSCSPPAAADRSAVARRTPVLPEPTSRNWRNLGTVSCAGVAYPDNPVGGWGLGMGPDAARRVLPMT